MSRLMVFTLLLSVSCSSLDKPLLKEISNPGYQYSRPMDERSMRAGFFER